MERTFLEYQQSIDSLTVFSELKQDPVIYGLRQLFASLAETPGLENHDLIHLYSNVLAALYPHGADLSAYIRDLVLTDDNFYVQAVAAGKPLDDEIQEAARRELNLLQDLSMLDSYEIKEATGYDGYMPSWSSSKIYLISDFMRKLERIPVTGYGICADYTFFRIADGPSHYPAAHSPAGPGSMGSVPFHAAPGAPCPPPFGQPCFGASPSRGLIVPVAHPDVQPLHQLLLR